MKRVVVDEAGVLTAIGFADNILAVFAVFFNHAIHVAGRPQTLDQAEQQAVNSDVWIENYLLAYGHDPETWRLTSRNLFEQPDAWLIDLTVRL